MSVRDRFSDVSLPHPAERGNVYTDEIGGYVMRVEVEIDAVGRIHPVPADVKLPKGRAVLIISDEDDGIHLLSEAALAKDWLSPEEDEAWAYLQPVK